MGINWAEVQGSNCTGFRDRKWPPEGLNRGL
jgi:hypothetical protein